jgi:hypothetical protein
MFLQATEALSTVAMPELYGVLRLGAHPCKLQDSWPRPSYEVQSSKFAWTSDPYGFSYFRSLVAQNSFSKPAIAATNDRSFLQSYHRSQHFIVENGHFFHLASEMHCLLDDRIHHGFRLCCFYYLLSTYVIIRPAIPVRHDYQQRICYPRYTYTSDSGIGLPDCLIGHYD